MPLGLDLRGGLDLLYQVDVNSSVAADAAELFAGLGACARGREDPRP